jgi:hypothetical protein
MKIEDLGPKDVVHCDTEEKANKILKLAHENGNRWRIGSLLEANDYMYYKSETCYDFNDIYVKYCNREWYIKNGYKIISADTILSEENTTSIDTKPQGVVGSPAEFQPGIYWHYSETVEVVYLESLAQMEALPGCCEFVHPCPKPEPKFVKWVPSLEVPDEFWVKLGTIFERFYGCTVVSSKNHIEVYCGKNIGQNTHSFRAENIYVVATL